MFSLQQKQNDVALSDILGEELLHVASTTPGGSSSDALLSPEGTPDSALQDHALRQAELSRELQGLNEILEKKERLASQMLQNDDQMNTMMSTCHGVNVDVSSSGEPACNLYHSADIP